MEIKSKEMMAHMRQKFESKEKRNNVMLVYLYDKRKKEMIKAIHDIGLWRFHV